MKLRIFLFAILLLCLIAAPALADTYSGYVVSRSSNALGVLDENGNAISQIVTTDATPYMVVLNPSGTLAYVSCISTGTINVFRTSDYVKVSTITVPSAIGGMTMNPSGNRLYAATFSGIIYVIDTSANQITATIIDSDVGALIENIYYSSYNNMLYAGDIALDKILVINPTTNTITAKIASGHQPFYITGTPSSQYLWISNYGGASVSKFDMTSNTITATVNVGAAPRAHVENAAGTLIFVPNAQSNTVSVINTASDTVTNTINVGVTPYACALSSTEQTLYVANYGGTNITMINAATYAVSGAINTTFSQMGYMGTYKVSNTNPSTIAPMQVTFSVNNAGMIYYSDLNVSVYDAYTNEFIASDPTDTGGNSIFWLIPGQRYTVIVSGNGINSISQSVQIQPTQEKYSINVIPTIDIWNPFTWFDINGSSNTGSPDQSRSITAKRTGTLIGTTGYLDVIYNDTTGKTTAVNFTLYLLNSTAGTKDYVTSHIVNSNDAEYNFTILNAVGKTYKVNISGTNPLYGTVYREGDWTFTPTYAYDMGWPQYFYLFFALGISLAIGYLSSKRNTIAGGALLIVFLSMFWSIGWMSMLGLAMPVLLAVLTILLVVYAVAKWRIQNGV